MEGFPPTPCVPATGPVPTRLRLFFRASLILAVLTLHFWTRQQASHALPSQMRAIYPYTYRVSLSLLAGNGFHSFRLSEVPESQPVVAFLNLQKPSLSPEEFEAFRRGPDAHPVLQPVKELQTRLPLYGGEGEILSSPLHTTRILDVYVAAALWKTLGIHWSVLFAFYSLVSTASCALVFAIGRRLGGGFWPGLLAALFYLASPLECDYAARSLRDVSPLWFAALGFFGLVCLVGRFHSPAGNLAAAGVTGILATLGCGWRPDALLLAPFLGLSLVVCLRCGGWRWRAVGLNGATFLLGAFLTHAGINALCREPRQATLVGFHMAYYGDHARCNVLELENSFQILRDDIQTCVTANHFHDVYSPGSVPVTYLSSGYGDACAALFREQIGANAFHWVSRFPEFYFHALRSCRLQDLPVNADWFPPKPLLQSSALDRAWAFGAARLNRSVLWFFALGAAAALARWRQQPAAACLAAFSVFHALVLFAVLPEHKHAAPLVLPLAVLAGLGCWSLSFLGRPTAFGRAWKALSLRTLLRAAAFGGIAGLGWLLACGLTYRYSTAKRQALLEEVQALADRGEPAPETIKDPRLFSVTLLPGQDQDPVGYLLHVLAGAEPGGLECRHVRWHHPQLPGRGFFARHRLQPGREQFFFVSCLQGSKYGDPRPLTCTVLLNGDAHLLSCRRVNLSRARLPLLSTVFSPGEASPGSPQVGGATGQTFYELPANLDALGLFPAEHSAYPNLPSTPVGSRHAGR